MSLTDELIRVSDTLKEVVTDRNENYIKVSELRETLKEIANGPDGGNADGVMEVVEILLEKFCGEKYQFGKTFCEVKE